MRKQKDWSNTKAMSKNTIKKLTQHKIQKAGRNNYGRITVCHRGGGNKKLYRLIDYKRSLFNIPAIVKNIDYDPNRSSYIALISYQNGMLSYILAPKNLNIGDTIIATRRQNNVEISIGNTSAISNLPTGTIIHNIELKPGQGGKLMRSAGTHAKIITKSLAEKNAIIRLHSGKLYSIPLESMATIGIVSNDLHKNKKLKKAGESR